MGVNLSVDAGRSGGQLIVPTPVGVNRDRAARRGNLELIVPTPVGVNLTEAIIWSAWATIVHRGSLF